MDPGILGVIIGAAVALIGVAVAAAVAVYQVTKQARMGLKVDLYRKALEAIEAQEDAERELSTKLRVLRSLIGVWQSEQFGGLRPHPNTSWAELHDLFYRTQSQASQLIMLTERWQIVEPKLDLFRLAFGSALHDLREAWPAVSATLGLAVPVVPGGPLPPHASSQALEDVAVAIDRVLNVASGLSAWVADFQLELQRLLLSDLFPNQLTHREPLDPELFVVRLDRYKALKHHFLKETPWGREMERVNERTRAAIAERRSSPPTISASGNGES